jgi:hypothetical protein
MGAPGLHAWESHQFANETEKLKAIQEVVRTLALREPYAQDQFCAAFIEDFRAGRNIAAIEPVARADSYDDPGIAKWRRCDDATQDDMRTDDPNKLGYNGIGLFGGPPFRYYRIEIDGNPHDGPEDLLYHESVKRGSGYGRTGYTWVDLEGCAIRGGAPIATGYLSDRSRPELYRLNMVVVRGEVPVMIELAPNRPTATATKYRFKATRLDRQPPAPMVMCSWREHAVDMTDKQGEKK